MIDYTNEEIRQEYYSSTRETVRPTEPYQGITQQDIDKEDAELDGSWDLGMRILEGD
tara:strand:- start:8333 stop:8503 length:171 start_codon:yes stop_codon:yes gene_type:complete